MMEPEHNRRLWRAQTCWLSGALCAVLLSGCAPFGGPPPDAVAQVPGAAEEALAVVPRPSASPTPAASATRPASQATPTRNPGSTSTPPRPTSTTLSALVTPTATPIPLEPTATLAPLSADQRAELFDEVWSIVNDQYVYEDFRGIDWAALREELAPQVDATQSEEELYGLLRTMIERLGDDHSRFASPQDVAAEEARFGGQHRYGGIGAMVRTINEGGLVTNLARGGPAERAGIRPRDLILRVGTIAFTNTAAFGPGGPISVIVGEPGTRLDLTVQSPGERPRRLRLMREVIPGDAFVSVVGERLPGTNVALLRIDTFYLQSIDELVRDELIRLTREPLNGVIVDLRANGGGRVDLMLNTLSLFIDGGSIGSSSGRTSSSELEIPSGRRLPEIDELPVAVLIGDGTVSAAEMFAAGMQARGRAQIVGLPSAGNTESMRPHSLSDGSRLWLAELTYRRPDGSLIEGRGVPPDRLISAEWWRYASADDPQVKAALDEIRQLQQASAAS